MCSLSCPNTCVSSGSLMAPTRVSRAAEALSVSGSLTNRTWSEAWTYR